MRIAVHFRSPSLVQWRNQRAAGVGEAEVPPRLLIYCVTRME